MKYLRNLIARKQMPEGSEPAPVSSVGQAEDDPWQRKAAARRAQAAPAEPEEIEVDGQISDFSELMATINEAPEAPDVAATAKPAKSGPVDAAEPAAQATPERKSAPAAQATPERKSAPAAQAAPERKTAPAPAPAAAPRSEANPPTTSAPGPAAEPAARERPGPAKPEPAAQPATASEPAAPAPAAPRPQPTAQPEPRMDGGTGTTRANRPEQKPAAEPAATATAAPASTTQPATPGRPPHLIEVPAPAAGRTGRRAGRVKTRMLGFEEAHGSDPFADGKAAGQAAQANFPVGWLVVVQGPGRGASFTLFNGVSQIGRGEDQPVCLDFGDTSISRSNHAAIAYDDEQRTFFLGHGGKANLVRLNDRPVLSTEELGANDLIRIGETTLRFVALCGQDFDWGTDDHEDGSNAAIA